MIIKPVTITVTVGFRCTAEKSWWGCKVSSKVRKQLALLLCLANKLWAWLTQPICLRVTGGVLANLKTAGEPSDLLQFNILLQEQWESLIDSGLQSQTKHGLFSLKIFLLLYQGARDNDLPWNIFTINKVNGLWDLWENGNENLALKYWCIFIFIISYFCLCGNAVMCGH